MHVLVCLLGLLCLVLSVSCYCPNGWTRYDNSCYLFQEDKNSWHDSKQHCADLDGHLARIEDTREKDYLEQSLRARHKFDAVDKYAYWIDGNDMSVEGDWYWEHNQSMTYFDWGPGEPNSYHGGDQDCICLFGHWHFQMDDNSCAGKFSSICELTDVIDEGRGNLIG